MKKQDRLPTANFTVKYAALQMFKKQWREKRRPNMHLHADGSELAVALLACARIGAYIL